MRPHTPIPLVSLASTDICSPSTSLTCPHTAASVLLVLFTTTTYPSRRTLSTCPTCDRISACFSRSMPRNRESSMPNIRCLATLASSKRSRVIRAQFIIGRPVRNGIHGSRESPFTFWGRKHRFGVNSNLNPTNLWETLPELR